jgi:hypothetical protein
MRLEQGVETLLSIGIGFCHTHNLLPETGDRSSPTMSGSAVIVRGLA